MKSKYFFCPNCKNTITTGFKFQGEMTLSHSVWRGNCNYCGIKLEITFDTDKKGNIINLEVEMIDNNYIG